MIKFCSITALALTLLLSSFSAANQAFWTAVADQNEVETQRILEEDPTIEIDYTHPKEHPNSGITALWWAAAYDQWDLFNAILEKFPKADINVSPVHGSNIGMTVLLWAAFSEQWETAFRLLKTGPITNINSAPIVGDERGMTVILAAAQAKKWNLVDYILKTFPDTNINARGADKRFDSISVVGCLAEAQRWGNIEFLAANFPSTNFAPMLSNLNLEIPTPILKQLLVRHLVNPSLAAVTADKERLELADFALASSRIIVARNALFPLIGGTAWALLDKTCIPIKKGTANLNWMPYDLRFYHLALHTLWANDPDLKRVPTALLIEALRYFAGRVAATNARILEARLHGPGIH